jgi:hypothetical protein
VRPLVAGCGAVDQTDCHEPPGELIPTVHRRVDAQKPRWRLILPVPDHWQDGNNYLGGWKARMKRSVRKI